MKTKWRGLSPGDDTGDRVGVSSRTESYSDPSRGANTSSSFLLEQTLGQLESVNCGTVNLEDHPADGAGTCWYMYLEEIHAGTFNWSRNNFNND